MSPVTLFLGVFIAVLQNVGTVSSIGTNATCAKQYSWMNNSRGQNPCLVTAYLGAACPGGDNYIESIPATYVYGRPTAHDANECSCSTVYYSMISACEICQDGDIDSWSGWIYNCDAVYVEMWPKDIPSGTSIPKWAYLDVVTSDAFNVSAAEALEDPPNSSSSSSSSKSSTTRSSSSTTSSATSHTSSSSSSSKSSSTSATKSHTASATAASSKKSNVGAVLAGALLGGGVAAATLVGLVVCLAYRRVRRTRTVDTASYSSLGTTAPENATLLPQQPPQTHDHDLQPMRLYNPYDPVTFPSAHVVAPGVSGAPGATTYGEYTGVAEL